VATTVLTFHVQPRASATEIVGWHGDAIKVRVAAPPVDGAANEALTRFIADELDVSCSAVQVIAGGTSRRKRVAIDGVDGGKVLEVLGVG
jgi:uncharacterized protein (TIGR00251 family)